MPFGVVAAGVVGAIGGALISGHAATKAADTQASAARDAANQQRSMFDVINQQQAPWRQAGQTALSDIAARQGDFTHQFNAADLKTNLAPNYDFQLQQGLGAVRNQASLNSGAVSGNTLKGINDYAQNYAGNAYQQAFQNYTANQTNIFNRLSNIAGLGQTANQATGVAGTQLAGNAGQATMAAGAAQAAGQVGTANALAGGLQNAASWYNVGQLLSQPSLSQPSSIPDLRVGAFGE
jgi:hypothetical protein